MKDYGIKVSKSGFDVKYLDANNENPNLSFTSKYDVLKVSSMGSGTFNTGSTATIAHGLGYPAAFITYLSLDNSTWHIYDGRSYIDSTNLVIGKDQPTTTNYYYMATGDDNCADYVGGTYFVGYGMGVGRGSTYNINGGMRFPSVTETSGITSAEIGLKIQYPSPRTGAVEVLTYGIDEDNTANFSSEPFGRTRTTAYVDNSCDNGITDIWAYDVTSIVSEILGRSGWSSGNAMGFTFLNDANSDNHYIQTYSDTNSYLKITRTTAPQTVYYKYVIFTNKLDSSKTI